MVVVVVVHVVAEAEDVEAIKRHLWPQGTAVVSRARVLPCGSARVLDNHSHAPGSLAAHALCRCRPEKRKVRGRRLTHAFFSHVSCAVSLLDLTLCTYRIGYGAGEKNGLPKALAENPADKAKVKKIIARMKAEAMVASIKSQFRHDDAKVSDIVHTADPAVSKTLYAGLDYK